MCRALQSWHALVAVGLVSAAAVGAPPPGAPGATDAPESPAAPERLKPLAVDEPIPPIVVLPKADVPDPLARRAKAREYEQRIRKIAFQHLRSRVPEVRAEGVAQLLELTDPVAFEPLIEVLGDHEDDTVRLLVLDHLASQGDEGQVALARLAVTTEDSAFRDETIGRIATPPSPPVLAVLDEALRSSNHQVAANAGTLAGALHALETIPLLINAQVAQTPRGTRGDLAWIAVQKQTVYVQSLNAVVGSASGAFQPVPAVLTEGFVFRVQDAVVVIYRAAVNHALVTLTTDDYGQPTADLGYDRLAWIDWYNKKYVPFKNEQAIIAELAQ